MGLRLIIEDVEGATTIVPLSDEDEVTIGRKGGNTIQLTEQNVSRNHARLRLDDGNWNIVDLQSYNGVLVNGAAVQEPSTLHEGDLIQIGDYHLVLADELEKRTVDVDPPKAANDEEPLLASSSADLPKLSPSELAALRSGAQAAAPYQGEEAYSEEDEREGGGMGPKIVVLAALFGIVGGGAFLFMKKGGGDEQIAAKESAKAEPKAAVEPPAEPVAADAVDAGAGSTGAAEPEDGETGAAALALATGESGEADAGTGMFDPGAADATGAEEPAAEPEPAPVAVDEPAPGPVKRKKKKKKSKASQPAPEPAPAPAPKPSGKSATEYMADARKAAMAGDSSTAYRLAKEAYAISKGQDALQLMGVSACKMGDAAKARKAHAKLRGSKQSALASMCASKGIEL